MRFLTTPEQMARADEATVAAGTPVEALMDRAGRAVARAAIDMLGGRYGRKVVVVCGKGNNGGDGYAAARVLHREGVGVRCLTVADPSELSGAARVHYERAVRAGVRVDPFDGERLRGIGLVIDAIWGTGYTGPRSDLDAQLDPSLHAVRVLGEWKRDELLGLSAYGAAPAPLVLAVDIPSGLHGEHGVVGGTHVIADRTVTFGAEKVGTFLADPRYVGDVEIVDIGLQKLGGHISVLEAPDVIDVLGQRRFDAHKKSSGPVGVIAGSDAMTGAAALVVRGAMRAGAGYVNVLTTGGAAAVVHELCPEAIVSTAAGDHLGPETLDAFSGVLADARALAIGPGLGQGDDQKRLVTSLLREFEGPVVADADALNVLAGDADALARENTVITPHPGELSRLLGIDTRKVQDRRIDSTVEATRRFGCVVVLKGFRSVIGGPSGGAFAFVSQEEWNRVQADPQLRGIPVPFADVDVFLNPTGDARLATAGTGDVLTGAIAAVLPQGGVHDRRPERVAAAVYIHGVAGELLDEGAVAWDVAEALPDALAVVRGGGRLSG